MESHTLRLFIAELTGKKVMMRGNYRQSSAAGGAILCNKALGRPEAPPASPDIVTPASDHRYRQWHTEWKNTRSSLRQIFTP